MGDKRSVYSTCDPHYLRELREASGMEWVVLARIACLSVAQVKALESEDSGALFYSDAIKRQAYKRVLMILGAEPPTVEIPQDLLNVDKVAEVHLSTLAEISTNKELFSVRHSNFELMRTWLADFFEYKQRVAAVLVMLVAMVLFFLTAPEEVEQTSPKPASAPASVSVPQSVVPVRDEPPAVVAPVVSTASVAVVPVAPVASPLAVSAFACAYSDAPMPELTSFVANKEGRYVYLLSPTDAAVCVVDGNKQISSVQLKAGEGRSIYGVAPWQVSGPNLPKLQIYFQGGRVSVPDAADRVKLVETALTR